MKPLSRGRRGQDTGLLLGQTRSTATGPRHPGDGGDRGGAHTETGRAGTWGACGWGAICQGRGRLTHQTGPSTGTPWEGANTPPTSRSSDRGAQALVQRCPRPLPAGPPSSRGHTSEGWPLWEWSLRSQHLSPKAYPLLDV